MAGDEYVPSVPGKLILSHWSNGNPLWSGGPPENDAKLLVSYVKAYFNSSDKARIADHRARCVNPSAAEAICKIPDQEGPPKFGKIYFFSHDPSGNMTNNQTIYAKTLVSSAAGIRKRWEIKLLVAVFISCFGNWCLSSWR
jgi:hypothetical protein